MPLVIALVRRIGGGSDAGCGGTDGSFTPDAADSGTVTEPVPSTGSFLGAVSHRIGPGQRQDAGTKAVAHQTSGAIIVGVREQRMHGTGAHGPSEVARATGLGTTCGAADPVGAVPGMAF